MLKPNEIRSGIARIFHPRRTIIALLVLATIAGLVWCFLLGGEGTPPSYAIYTLSAYTLATLIVALAPFMRKLWNRLLRNRRFARIVQDEKLRAGITGTWAVLFDLAYAIFIMATGFAYDSGWAIAVALYHVAIAGMGFAITFGLIRARKLTDEQKTVRELRSARTCGILLAFMALSLSGVMEQMVINKQAWLYSDIIVITSATFTFLNLGLSVNSAIRVRKLDQPSLIASRTISLSKTLVQLFFLETTMIAVFGNGEESFRFAMEAISGGVIFLFVLAIAIGLTIFAIRKLRAIEQSGQTNL